MKIYKIKNMNNSIVIDRDLLPPKIQHVTALDIINILTAFTPIVKMPRAESIVSKGREGEHDINLMINQNFEREKPGSHSGDLIIWKRDYPNIRILIEVKNYTNTVPHSEFIKFENDVESGIYAGGVFISNQPISGVHENVMGNKMIVTQFNKELINIACESLWQRARDRMTIKMLNDDNKLIRHCEQLMTVIDDLKRVNHENENLRRSSVSIMDRTIQTIGGAMVKIGKSVDRVTMGITSVDTLYNTKRVIMPTMKQECTLIKLGACDKLMQLLEKLAEQYNNAENVLMVQKSNTCEYTLGEKKIALTFLKSKINVTFQPRVMDFTDHINISYDKGLVTAHVTDKNFNSDRIYETIMKLF